MVELEHGARCGLSRPEAVYAAALHRAWFESRGRVAGLRELAELAARWNWNRVWSAQTDVLEWEQDIAIPGRFAGAREKVDLEALEKKIDALDISIVPRGSRGYPAAWEHLSDAPPLAYVRGIARTVEPRAVAMVGTRKPDEYGRLIAGQLGAALALSGAVVVSGLAQGIDSCAHEGVLRGRGRTVAILGTGVDRIYPRQNRGLAQRILERGALVSELPLGARATRWSFPQRNRLIAALGQATIVVQANRRSGTRYTVDAALELGRQVFAVPGAINNSRSEGPHHLIRDGAILLENADQVFEELGWEKVTERTDSTDFGQGGHDELDTVLALVGRTPVAFHTLARQSGFSVPVLQTALLQLELGGAVRQLPGLRFVRIS